MATEPLIEWPKAGIEFVGFIGSFLASGAVGFRWVVLRRWLAPAEPAGELRTLAEGAASRAGRLGLIGAGLGALLLSRSLPGFAARQHTTVAALVSGDLSTMTQVGGFALAMIGFWLAWRRVPAGWPLAAIGVIASALHAAAGGQWERLINPIHRLAGGMWIGTLFMLVVTGIAGASGGTLTSERRERFVADMVHAFSPFALASAAVLAFFGMITAWRHLETLPTLWSSTYGIALMVKLCAVSVVVALGGWNWRRQTLRLGRESGALMLRRTARAELLAALAVLVITAILVSTPDPH